MKKLFLTAGALLALVLGQEAVAQSKTGEPNHSWGDSPTTPGRKVLFLDCRSGSMICYTYSNSGGHTWLTVYDRNGMVYLYGRLLSQIIPDGTPEPLLPSSVIVDPED